MAGITKNRIVIILILAAVMTACLMRTTTYAGTFIILGTYEKELPVLWPHVIYERGIYAARLDDRQAARFAEMSRFGLVYTDLIGEIDGLKAMYIIDSPMDISGYVLMNLTVEETFFRRKVIWYGR